MAQEGGYRCPGCASTMDRQGRMRSNRKGRAGRAGPEGPEANGHQRVRRDTEGGYGSDMSARTMNGEPEGPGTQVVGRWRPVPWEVISVIFTVVMVGAVVSGLVLAALGEIREDVRVLSGRVGAVEQRIGAVEQRVAAVERGQTAVEGKLEGLIEGLRKIERRVSVVEHGQARLEGLIEGLRDAMARRPLPVND